MASLAKKSIAYTLRSYPSAYLWNPKLKAGVTEVHWSVEIQQPIPPLSDSPAVQINGATALLLQADMGWDKWLQSWSLCVAAAEPPWNSLHSIWCPSPLPALHMLLLKDLVILEPNSSKFKTQCNLWKWKELSVSHKFFWSVEIEQPLLVAKLTRAEINGFRAGRCVWRPPSLHEILFIPYDVHLHFLLFTCFFWKILSCLNQIHPNSKRSATYKNGKSCRSHTSFLKRRDWTASFVAGWHGLR